MTPKLEQATILVVDDEQAIVTLLVDILTDAGYRVITARNGREALVCLDRERADLIISDVMMPVMDGLALYHTLQVSPTLQSIPMILMSAVASFNSQIRGNSNTQLITKPFDLDMLLATIDRYLAQQ